MIKTKERRFRNPIETIKYREFSIIIHKFEDGDYYCPGFYFEIIKPDNSPFWLGGYISGGFEIRYQGLHQMFRKIDDFLCEDIEQCWTDENFDDIEY